MKVPYKYFTSAWGLRMYDVLPCMNQLQLEMGLLHWQRTRRGTMDANDAVLEG